MTNPESDPPLTDRELIERVKFPINKTLPHKKNEKPRFLVKEIFDISRQAFQRGLSDDWTGRGQKKKRFLDLDRLLILYEYLRSEGDEAAITELKHEVRRRYGDALRRLAFFHEADLANRDAAHEERFLFNELWIITPEPIEVVDRTYIEDMLPYYKKKAPIVYFTSHESALKLRGYLKSISARIQNVYIVASEMFAVMPHSLIRFGESADDGSSTIRAYIALKGMEDFPEAPPEWAEAFFAMMSDAGITEDFRFFWPEEKGPQATSGSFPILELIYPER